MVNYKILLATQARDQIAMGGGKDGKGFVTVVDSNARNKIVYPGSFSDADFYSKQFGEVIEMETKQNKSYDTFAGTKGFFADKISESTSEVKKVRFSPTDIVFRPFGEITYCIIKNNSIQPPGVSKIQYIPRELNDLLDKMVAEYNELQMNKSPNAKTAIEKNLSKEEFSSDEDLGEDVATNSSDVVIVDDEEIMDIEYDGMPEIKIKDSIIKDNNNYNLGSDINIHSEDIYVDDI